MSAARALRYRKLALAEQDPDAAQLLRLIAEEAERGLLSIADRESSKQRLQAVLSVEPGI